MVMCRRADYYADKFIFLPATLTLCSSACRICFTEISHFSGKIRGCVINKWILPLQYQMTHVFVSALQGPLCLSSLTADRRWARTAAWTSQSRGAWARRAVHVLPELGHWERVQGEGRGAPLNRWDRENQRERENSHLKIKFKKKQKQNSWMCGAVRIVCMSCG